VRKKERGVILISKLAPTPNSVTRFGKEMKMPRSAEVVIAIAKGGWAVIYWSCMGTLWLYFVLMGLLMTVIPFYMLAWAVIEVPKAPHPLYALVAAIIGILFFGGCAISGWIIMVHQLKEWFGHKTKDGLPTHLQQYVERRRNLIRPQPFNWYEVVYRGDERNYRSRSAITTRQ